MADTEFVIEPGKQDVVIIRTFDAPRDVVFQALTDPKLIPNWWGPRRYETVVDTYEPKPGGRWRFINKAADGTEFGFHGVFHQVTPERTTQTSEFEGMPGHVALEILTLEELPDGRTRYVGRTIAESVEDRDAVVASGMQEGATETLDRLAEVVAKLHH